MKGRCLPVLGDVPDERLQRLLVEALGHPVERGAEVVDQFLAGVLGTDFACERGGFLDVRVTGLNPEEVGVRGEFFGALGGCGEAGAVVVEALAGAWAVA